MGATEPWYIACCAVDGILDGNVDDTRGGRQATARPAKHPLAAGVVPADEALAARVAQRDATALAELYDRYAAVIYALAAHMLGAADAEEIVQEVFLSLWRKAAQFDADRRPFGAWLMAIARHRVLDELRQRGYRYRVQVSDSVDRALAAAPDPGASVEDEVGQRERGVAVLRALQQLPEEQRRVLVLAYFGGLSHSAMAARLGWPLGTVKKRVRLGLHKLRAALAGFAPAGALASRAGTVEQAVEQAVEQVGAVPRHVGGKR